MNLSNTIFNFLLVVIGAGITATTGMMIVLSLISKYAKINADMVGAIGSLLTRSMDSAYRVGTLIHLSAGIFFAGVYVLALQYLGLSGFAYIFAGLFMGLVHGYIISFFLVVAVAEHHPLPIYKEAGLGIAAGHFVAHGVYGLIIGTCLYLSGFSVKNYEREIADKISYASVADCKPKMMKAQLNISPMSINEL